MKLLLLLTGAAAAAVATAAAAPKAWPCPTDTDIYPCVCTISTTGEPDLDCSDVTSNTGLATVFQASFPYLQFSSLVIQPDTGHPALTAIESYVFGDVSFQYVNITNTYIRTVEEEAFAPSHDTLISLDLSNNGIEAFPVETMAVFEHLRIFNISNNKLPSLPDLESSSLLILDLSYNLELTVTDTTFVGLTELEELYLNNMGITSLPANVFSSITFLNILDLSNNDMEGALEEDIIRVPLDSLEDLRLNDNDLTQIHSSAITGMNRAGMVDFSNNQFTTLDYDNWYPLLDQLTGVQVVDLEGNELECGCDVLWLLLDSTNLDKIQDSATCSDGTPFKDTDIDPLLILC